MHTPDDKSTYTVRPAVSSARSARCAAVATAAVLVASLLAGCTKAQYATQADKAAMRVLDQKQKVSLGAKRRFSIDYAPYQATGDAQPAMLNGKPIPTGDEPVRTLSLHECLQVAFANARELQDRKETLYLSALSLANSRHRWSGFRGLLTGDVSRTVEELGNRRTIKTPVENTNQTSNIDPASAPTLGSGNEPITQEYTVTKTPSRIETNDATSELAISFEQRLVNGGILTLAAAMNLTSDLLNMDGTTFGSSLDATFTQPLLRGAAAGLAFEDLYREERDVAFDVLEYERFTQEFATEITADFYGVLQRLDKIANEEANIERLEQALQRITVQLEGGQATRIERDQTEQNLLDAQVRYANANQTYLDQLDRFKIRLGLPVQANIQLDGTELADLNRTGPASIPLLVDDTLDATAEEAATQAAAAFDRDHPVQDDEVIKQVREAIIERSRTEAYNRAFDIAAAEAFDRATGIALHARPEVLRQMAKVRDASRDVEIAADDFLPQLDLELGINVHGKKPHDPWEIQWNKSTRRAKLVLDYSLDQTDNRDNYRTAQLAEAKALRDYQKYLDNTRLDVVSSYRELLQARQSYAIQERNVAISQRRSALAAMQQAEGEASARDVLEAESALLSAQNGLTSALVNYETTRITFLASLGMLDVDSHGRFTERDTPFLFTELGKRYGNVEDIDQ